MATQQFGGIWTVEKLDIFTKYLKEYLKVMKNQPYYHTIYIDAFAGTGKIDINGSKEEIEGSVRLALNSDREFDKYIFIEKKKSYARELRTIVDSEYNNLSNKIEIKNEDCNLVLQSICRDTKWHSNRAMLFLDPYAADVEWNTLEAVAATKAIDVWYLFPFSAAQRMLKKDGKINESWKNKLDSLFGDKNWYNRFYIPDPQTNIFGEEGMIKDVNTKELSSYIIERLEALFPAVAKEPRMLHNKMNSPLFLFCFAIANDSPKAIGAALRIANHILKN